MNEGNCETRQHSYEEQGQELRASIKEIALKVKSYMGRSKAELPARGDNSFDRHQGEMIANSTLSYRHLEDAAMRIGKAMQAYQGGVSILDKMTDEERAEISSR
jgi:hypothetical protein